MFKLVQAVGKLVVRLYQREARLKLAEAIAMGKASSAAIAASRKLLDKSRELDKTRVSLLDESAELSAKASKLQNIL